MVSPTKIAPAIAAGNTVVLKPAEYTSLTALYFAELCQKARIPKGVINIITGDGSTGELITSHPDTKKIAFTGSTEVGKQIIQSTSISEKKLTRELGGKSPFIVFEDADLDSAVEGVVDAIWFNQGQVCCAGSRLFAHEKVFDQVSEGIAKIAENIKVGELKSTNWNNSSVGSRMNLNDGTLAILPSMRVNNLDDKEELKPLAVIL